MLETDKDLAEINEYYLDELGKIQDLRPDIHSLTKREGKLLHKFMFSLYYSDLINWKEYKKSKNMIEKTEIKKSREDYIESQKQQKLSKPSIFKRLASIFKRGSEITIENNAPQSLEQCLDKEEPKVEVIEGEGSPQEQPKEQENGQSNPVSQPQTSQEVNGTGERTGQPQ